MALDYLPIQASSVPSKRVFSSSAKTYTKRWNQIHPVLMEALQMLKFLLKQQWLNFMDGWAITEDELQYYTDDDEDSADLLGKLTSEIREDGIDIDEVIHVVGQDDDDWLGHFLFNINVYNLTYPHIVHFWQILLHFYLHCT